jgi:hypothetical protein
MALGTVTIAIIVIGFCLVFIFTGNSDNNDINTGTFIGGGCM